MPVSREYTAKNGLSSLNRTAKALCRAVTFAGPAIRAQYPENTALIAALTTAESLCAILPSVTDDQIIADQIVAAPIPDYDDAGVRPGRLP